MLIHRNLVTLGATAYTTMASGVADVAGRVASAYVTAGNAAQQLGAALKREAVLFPVRSLCLAAVPLKTARDVWDAKGALDRSMALLAGAMEVQRLVLAPVEGLVGDFVH